mmetsp:Transcript_20310/g.41831  ORF Transcript_20310/g.41831 Transcript_20310/m.41831 type:complete len:257 (+) Transcript_20310:109-879(+)|eukprot:CAMPEP_0197263540 /NCGR_PEP_ID=MMETSP1432-20130617/1232_1 /TAXON_ID=44447 /ORGANISM="Pseudo-nitzschia delicatissima, Strain UNC1205" /LENGTH=256 /DNA_ID=CAMNT_0042728051 /DNA_START=111 /DNA_END=881 /DNA_ORIENTATION=+
MKNTIRVGVSVVALILLGNASVASCFAPPSSAILSSNNAVASRISDIALGAMKNSMDHEAFFSRRSMVASLAASVAAVSAKAAFADEYGRETEMSFLSTGETVEICVKRGPLGRCEKTERRTAENENDKSEKYFRQPTELVKRKDNEARTAESSEGNILIERLKKQSEENSEKNELLVYQRTLMNDSSASFGPFDSQVLILNEDGKGFTLLANPQAMRLKKAGFIENKKFVKQPTQEEIDAALEAEPNLLDRFFGN